MLDLHWIWIIEFIGIENGGVRADFLYKINDSGINQNFKAQLQIWMADYDLQNVLDEKKAIQYLVKYA